MNKLFYYLRDKENRPLITVCLIDAIKGVARGVAICSSLDQPLKKFGRALASKRARTAMRGFSVPETSAIASRRAKDILAACEAPRTVKLKSFLSEDGTGLTRMDRRILKKARAAREARP